MTIYDLYSKQHKKLENHDFYQYDYIPESFRVQVIYIWEKAIGQYVHSNYPPTPSPSNVFWWKIVNPLLVEKGLFTLSKKNQPAYNQCKDYILQANTKDTLDIIQLSFQVINTDIRAAGSLPTVKLTSDDAIAELNIRFQEHNLGYQFTDNKIIRIDSQYTHHAIVKPAVTLLQHVNFIPAGEEFLRAHEHFRHGRYAEAINEALKSFESTMKLICDGLGWDYSQTDTAKRLIKVLFDNALLPSMMSSQYTTLISLLESGIPTVRNKVSGHGLGSAIDIANENITAYALHLTATNIVFLVQSFIAFTETRSPE